MQITRRHMLATGAGAATLAATPRAFAAWEPSLRYPDPAVQVLDPSFAGYRVAQATV
jgi:gluconolactonase